MIKRRVKGSFKNAERFFSNSQNINQKFREIMQKYGQAGVEALQKATPKDSGATANSWSYTIEDWGLSFSNSNVVNGVAIAIILQYGHGTRNGGYVQGRDYINPTLQPIFDKISEDLEKEVRRL